MLPADTILQSLKKNMLYNLREGTTALLNWQRLRSDEPIGYVQFNLHGALPALPEPRGFVQQRVLGPAPFSLWELERAFQRIAADTRVSGVILALESLELGTADLQTLRSSITRLRAQSKRVICIAKEYNLLSYYVASAADEILLHPSGILGTTGLIQQSTYFKDALEAVGMQADAVAISPYKSAADRLTRNEPSPESQAMSDWLLDSIYEQLIAGIAEARSLSEDAVRAMVDTSPHIDLKALDAGFVDGLMNEEGLYTPLKTKSILLWEQAQHRVLLLTPGHSKRYVAVLGVSGSIVDGESADPPVKLPIPLVGGERMGDATVVRLVRGLVKDEDAAALVFYIDSGGGSATASEAMSAALEEFGRTRPIVVCMGNVAASGGYYIATPADWIVAQGMTITGSIGVLNAKFILDGALRRLRMNPVYDMRGENAGLFAPNAPFSEEQRAKVVESIERIYEQFIGRVADARKMKSAEVDAVGGGRVWTGAQALEHRLVDQLGGLYEAIEKARTLAKLPADVPLVLVRGKGKPLPAQVAEQADPAAALRYVIEGAERSSGRAQMLMPFSIRWR